MGLSQEELAFLLGGLEGTSVLRHENSERTPSLGTVLSYAAVFGVDPRELFAGLNEDALRLARVQAKELLKSTKGQLPTKVLERKVEFLERLSGTLEPHVVPIPDDDEACGQY